MSSTILIVCLILFMIIGIPVAFSLSWSGIFALLSKGEIPLLVFPQRLWVAIDSMPMLAIVFFVISGDLMLQGGISKRLINFVMAFFGKLRGALAVVSLVACALFGALSGSALATTAAIGGIMYPEMTKNNRYGKTFSAALEAAGGTLGTMIPPSITLILYANVTGASIASLFIADIVPGIIMCCMYIMAAMIYIHRRGYDKRVPVKSAPAEKQEEPEEQIPFWRAMKEGVWAILMPVIVLGGIYSGICTPTESAIIACVYAMLVGFFVYRELTIKKFYQTIVKSAVTSATIMLLCATANFFGWVMAILNIPSSVMNFLSSFMNTKFLFLLLINVVFLICGMFMDTSVIILLIIPLVYRAAQNLGINLVHFGCIACINLSMGMITPPFGTSLFVSANMTGIKIEPLYKEIIPYCIWGIIGILLVTYIEPLSMFIIK
ncbi:MAG: TRAP transporter large permease subunit [Lachnospiraceae bacterium]|nr:TRAP transporter large permease subunit [Lachnospiraceae bacterium]